MNTKLSMWKLNARKWREENGYTTPEWDMYVKNRNNMIVGIAIICFVYGMVVGFCAGSMS